MTRRRAARVAGTVLVVLATTGGYAWACPRPQTLTTTPTPNASATTTGSQGVSPSVTAAPTLAPSSAAPAGSTPPAPPSPSPTHAVPTPRVTPSPSPDAVATPAPTASPTATSSTVAATVTVYRTGYGWPDNDCDGGPGDCLAYGGQAGGTGTATDPVTLAAKAGAYAVGTLIYLVDLQLYGVVEDTCASCKGSQIDLWVGGEGEPAQQTLACEDAITGQVQIIVAPPGDLPVPRLAPVSSASGCMA